ncbi:asparagine synthase B [Aliikangiella marina]|uniref:asparagine synthase (glutamine-hydrolyzing) n=1 Tax=Aliikangiella marina TaxID=1712262 RepID=A0A545TBW5_9GAMM|nr:asparagine synthase B [Aliikangiella marina]TQV74691.1 asparagine synthase B [Aliikangiella marina]
MCSIFGILDIQGDPQELRALALAQSKKQRHRGPDWSGIWTSDSAVLVHERLAIVDINSGEQPLVNRQGDLALLVNGEIYNHKTLAESEIADYPFQTQSDCEVILGLYDSDRAKSTLVTSEMIEKRLNQLEGMFAFILFDDATGRYIVARDPIGIIPLYYGYDDERRLYVASEMKSLVGVCGEIHSFPPGHYLDSDQGEIVTYYKPDWKDYEVVAKNSASPADIRDAMVDSVKKHMMSDVPYGVLLSGGLDSSIVSAVAQLNAAKRVEDDQKSPAWWPQLHSFAVGLKGSPDLLAARKVADQIGTIHHEINFNVQQGIDALADVIYHLETYDVTTIRASTPMFLMARKIKSMGIKMVLSGEGADEIFGGYLYFHKAPNAKEFHEETVRKLERLHQFDCLRANKAMAAWGVEARVPFLDRKFLDAAMSISPEAKMCGMGANGQTKIEKHILREAFEGYLPEEILWRQKEQFSDGVGYSWIDSLKDYADEVINDIEMRRAAIDYPINTPDTKEGLLYRKIFEERFNSNSAAATVPGGKSVACSTKEALAWDESFSNNADPSGRAVAGVHAMAV